MDKNTQSGKQTVELRASKIRRDPPAPASNAERALGALRSYSTEHETWTVVIGVTIFAIAMTIIAIALSDFTAG